MKGTNSVIVSVLQPTEDQSNGAPVTSCIVEYAANDGNATKWESLMHSLKECSAADNKIKVTIDNLNGYIPYMIFESNFKMKLAVAHPVTQQHFKHMYQYQEYQRNFVSLPNELQA